MEESTRLLFEQLGIALLLGALVGLQRERSEGAIAGLRTFPLITMLGVIAASVDHDQNAAGWVIAAGFLAVVAVTVVTNIYQLRRDSADFGMTTEAAILLMYAVGAHLVGGDRTAAVAVGVSTAVLLQFKPELHGIAARLGDEDLRAVMTFALITGVILPILPNRTFELAAPFDVLNPFQIWMMVVLMAGISLGGYLLYKFFGRGAGMLLGGVLGGAISSTATTISYAKRTRTSPASTQLAAIVIAIASAVSFVRVMLEVFVVAPGYFLQVAAPIGIMMAAGLLAVAFIWFRARGATDEMPPQKNPTELKSALVFAALYAGVLMALSAAGAYFGGRGLYAIAAISGCADMDAITLSIAAMIQRGPDANGIMASEGWRLIVVASMSNLVFKWLIAAVAGYNRLRWQTALLLAAPFAAGGLVLWLWPG